MPQTPPLTRQQQWMYRHHRGVRIACAVVLVAVICSAVYNLAEHQIAEGVVSVLICGGPLGLIVGTRSLERTVAIRDGAPRTPDSESCPVQ